MLIGNGAERSRYSNRAVTIRNILIEQSLYTKYSNRAVTHACKLEILQLIFTNAKQNKKFSSKILSKIGKKSKNCWKEK